MKSYAIKFATFMFIPSFMIGFIVFHYNGYFKTAALEFGNTSMYEEKSDKLRSGELTLSQEKVADLFDSLASADTRISSGANMMAASTQYYLFALLITIIGQVFTLLAFIRHTRNINGNQVHT